MKKGLIVSAMAALVLASGALYAEPGNFGVNGPSGWNGPIQKRVKHTDQFGDTYYTEQIAAPKKSCIAKEVNHESKAVKKAPKEVIEGLNLTVAAMQDIENNKLKEARAKLEKATKLFDTALKNDPALKLVPLDSEIVVKQFAGSVNDIKADIVLATKMLKGYHTQAAIDLITPLQDEIDVTTHYVPMDLFPKAAKDALNYLKKGKRDAALRALVLGASTVVADEVVVPIPLLTAQDLIQAASQYAKKDPKAAIVHLRLAKQELHKALLLGYTDWFPKEYKSLYEQMTKIQKELKAHHETAGLFEKLKKDVGSLLSKTRNRKTELKDNGSFYKGTAKAHAKAAKEEDQDKRRFEEEMELDAF